MESFDELFRQLTPEYQRMAIEILLALKDQSDKEKEGAEPNSGEDTK